MSHIHVTDLTAYLATLRTEVAKHGRENVVYSPSEDGSLVGFKTPDGLWVIPVDLIRAVCAAEVGARMHRARRLSLAGKYATRQGPDTFVDWFSDKIRTAINDGEKLRANHGLS